MVIVRETRLSNAASIFGRLWGRLTPGVARYILRLGFSAAEKARVHKLLKKNQIGKLTASECEELDNLLLVADQVAILQSKARAFLGKKLSANRNGNA